ncbi:MAG: FGGY family carbohydrate kinase [Verrucomicrobiota bacterium]
MTTEAYLGLDIGGTGVKAGVFSQDGKMLAFRRRSFAPTVSADGHVDISIDIIDESARQTVHAAVKESGAKILAMAVSSQGETFVSLDENDRPLHDAIMWYDSRAGRQAKELCDAVQSAAGRVPSIDAIMTVSKIKWLYENRPELMRKARRFLLLPDYISYRLTGRAAIDTNTAASTGLLTPDEDKYDPAILKAGGIDLARLSTILIPGTPIGKISKPAAEAWGLSTETLVAAGTNDQYAGALGAGNCRPGILSETSGTCLALVTLTRKQPRSLAAGLLSGKFPIPAHWFILAYSKTAGLVLDWFRKECAGGASFEVLNAEALAVPIGCRGLTMAPHFDGMISPHPDPAMRGCFCGLTLQHTRADLYRSILEALSFSLRENMELMRPNGLTIEMVRCIGGGAQNEFWLQMKADVIGMAVEKPAVTESAVLGAAMLAALGAGAFSSLAETSAAWYRVGRVFVPDPANHEEYEAPYRRYRELTGETICRPS